MTEAGSVMQLVLHESVFAILAGAVLIWAHDTWGTVTWVRLRGNPGARGQVSQRTWQLLILGVGVVLLVLGVVSLAVHALSRGGNAIS